jgi:hypothetical protein
MPSEEYTGQAERFSIAHSGDRSFLYGAAGISRDSLHKRRLTGGKQKKWRKKRK